jgi:hypothetical protein
MSMPWCLGVWEIWSGPSFKVETKIDMCCWRNVGLQLEGIRLLEVSSLSILN